MFTVKAVDSRGHSVKACTSYRYNCVAPAPPGHTEVPPTAETIDLYADDGSLIDQLPILGTVYVMNLTGRTVDTFHARPT